MVVKIGEPRTAPLVDKRPPLQTVLAELTLAGCSTKLWSVIVTP